MRPDYLSVTPEGLAALKERWGYVDAEDEVGSMCVVFNVHGEVDLEFTQDVVDLIAEVDRLRVLIDARPTGAKIPPALSARPASDEDRGVFHAR